MENTTIKISLNFSQVIHSRKHYMLYILGVCTQHVLIGSIEMCVLAQNGSFIRKPGIHHDHKTENRCL